MDDDSCVSTSPTSASCCMGGRELSMVAKELIESLMELLVKDACIGKS